MEFLAQTVSMLRMTLSLFLAIALPNASHSRTVYVDPSGNDSGSGDRELPFRTIAKAASVMAPGDQCRIAAGSYRESVSLNVSGTADNPIRFIGETDKDGNPLVTMDGSDLIDANWAEVELNGITVYSIPIDDRTTQLFHNGRLMTEARWPDQPFERIWDRSTWAKGDPGGFKGKMISRDIAGTGIDWTGAWAVLNVGHQFKTWVRQIEEHGTESDTFTYRLDERMGNDKHDGPTWGDDRFNEFGKLQ